MPKPTQIDEQDPEFQEAVKRLDDVWQLGAEDELPDITPDERTLNRYVELLVETRAKLERVEEQHVARVKRLNNRLHAIEWKYGELARHITGGLIKMSDDKAKSIVTLYGTVGFRRQKPSLDIVNESKCMKSLEDSGLAGKIVMVKTTRVIDKASLNKIFTDGGIVPDGCAVVSAHDKFYVK